MNDQMTETASIPSTCSAVIESYVWLLTTGDGSDGNEWNVQSIHATESDAQSAKANYEKLHYRLDGSSYKHKAAVEKWRFS